jgi:Thioredoxin
MPRPPLLPLIDWPAVFESGEDWGAWLKGGKREENDARMAEDLRTLRLDHTAEVLLAALPRPVHVIAIAEDWCGDVVRHVPPLVRLVGTAPNLHVRFIRRDQHPEVFARFLTNGGEAIPKFIFLSADFVECGHWGPMPTACREVIARGKAAGDGKVARERVSAMYEADPNRREVIAELLHLIGIAATSAP